MQVEKPMLLPNLRALDFGSGFYLTSSRQQAEKWAASVFFRRKSGSPTVNIYDAADSDFESLHTLAFKSANGEWLDFVVKNRKNEYRGDRYDIVTGPVANDTTMRIVDDYMSGVYTKEEAIKRLLPQNLTDQYAFLTQSAIDILKYEGSEVL